MAPYSQITLCLALTTILALFHPSLADTQLITDTCKKIAQAEPSLGGNYDFCVKFLQSDPSSESATLEGLAVISFELARKRNVEIQSRIKELRQSPNFDDFAKKALGDCAEVYSDGASSLDQASSDFKQKDYSSANIHVSQAEDAPTNCEDGFKEKQGETSPLTQENDEMFKICGIALVFTNMFH